MHNILLVMLVLVSSGTGMTIGIEPIEGGYPGLDGWIPGWITWQTWFTSAPQHSIGNSVYYAPGVMEATAEYRELDLEGFLDGVSLMSPADIGKTVWIKHPEHGWEGPFLSVDCAQQNDMYNAVVYRGEVIEVGFVTAEKWGMVIQGMWKWEPVSWRLDGVEVFIGEELPDELDEPIDYLDWFLDLVEFRTRWNRRPVFYPPTTWRLPDGTFLDSSIYTH
jgi:hypothetical protein